MCVKLYSYTSVTVLFKCRTDTLIRISHEKKLSAMIKGGGTLLHEF
jgi:hypothetical protein